MQIFGVILMIVGAVMTFFVRGTLKSYSKRADAEDEDFTELLTMSATVFLIIGFAIVVVGAIIFFY